VGEAPLRSHPRKGERLKHLFELIGLTMIVVLVAVFLMGADRVVVVPCGQDLDAMVNADDPTIATRFQLEGPCTYPVDAVMVLNDGDEIAGPEATFIERPQPPILNPQSPS
jgi:hypothetical protein